MDWKRLGRKVHAGLLDEPFPDFWTTLKEAKEYGTKLFRKAGWKENYSFEKTIPSFCCIINRGTLTIMASNLTTLDPRFLQDYYKIVETVAGRYPKIIPYIYTEYTKEEK
jgi:hypothetical protein